MKIDLKKGQKIWFTSDSHYNHGNVCRSTSKWNDKSKTRDFKSHYNHGNVCRSTSKWDNKSKTRDFKSLQEMNNRLVDCINERVDKDDYLFHLGDFAFGGPDFVKEFRSRINCKNLHLILGNHDYRIKEDVKNTQSLFSSVDEYMFLTVFDHDQDETEKRRFVLCHYPIASWNGMRHGVIHLHGHLHLPERLRLGDGMVMDVGVEGNGWAPIEMSKVLEVMEHA